MNMKNKNEKNIERTDRESKLKHEKRCRIHKHKRCETIN